MKNIIKKIVAALMVNGLLFVPFFSSAQTSGNIENVNNNIFSSPVYKDKSQAEIEAIDEMLILEANSNLQPFYLNGPKKIKSRILKSASHVSNYDKSQAQVEAEEELLYILTISTFRKLYSIDLI